MVRPGVQCALIRPQGTRGTHTRELKVIHSPPTFHTHTHRHIHSVAPTEPVLPPEPQEDPSTGADLGLPEIATAQQPLPELVPLSIQTAAGVDVDADAGATGAAEALPQLPAVSNEADGLPTSPTATEAQLTGLQGPFQPLEHPGNQTAGHAHEKLVVSATMDVPPPQEPEDASGTGGQPPPSNAAGTHMIARGQPRQPSRQTMCTAAGRQQETRRSTFRVARPCVRSFKNT